MNQPEDDEFGEFDLTEAEFDAIMQRAHPARLVEPPRRQAGRTLYFHLSGGDGGQSKVAETRSQAFGTLLSA